MNAEGITIHNTANNAPAKNEIAYMIRNSSATSFHYAVDDVEIIQGIPENRNAFHAGDGNGNGNRKTIGIEICYSTGDKAKFEKAQENAAEFVAYKLKERGWGVDRVYTHKHWNGKNCPHRTLSDYGWDYFINLVKKYMGENDGGSVVTTSNSITYQTWDDVANRWLPNVVDDSDYAGVFGHDVCAVYANLSTGDCMYKVHVQGGDWLPDVMNRDDYAGVLNKPIDAFMIKSTDSNTTIYYQVHIRGGAWLPYVTGYNASDDDNGYAGIIGKPIDGIRMYAKTKTVIPAPVVTPTPTPEAVKYYRVRKEWSDAKSQKGAYISLESAIAKCQEAGEGYEVYDWEGKEVYSYVVSKIEPTPQPQPNPVEPEVKPTDPTPVKPEEPKVEPEIVPDPVPTPIEPDDEDKDDNDLPEIDKNWLTKLIKTIIEILFDLFRSNKDK
jgi:hypothetical protein